VLSFPIRFIPDVTTLPFVKWRAISFPMSAILSLLTVLVFFTLSLNFGIDFKGGTLLEIRALNGQANVALVRQKLENLSLGGVEVQEFGTQGDIAIRADLKGASEAEQQAAVVRIKTALKEGATDGYEFRRIESVGPRVSGELVQSGILGVIVAVFGVLTYLWFRFEWQFAVGAVIATLHDLALTIGFFAITQIEFNMTSIAAILTILGYSLNDTVVVYDRIREILRKYKSKPLGFILDFAINSTLSRTIITSVTTTLALLALALFGGSVLESFSYAMLFGVIIGTYSSIFIAAPMLIALGLKPSTLSDT
jgi:preprotein translocase subunit SecF